MEAKEGEDFSDFDRFMMNSWHENWRADDANVQEIFSEKFDREYELEHELDHDHVESHLINEEYEQQLADI